MNLFRTIRNHISDMLNNYFEMLARQATTGTIWDDWS